MVAAVGPLVEADSETDSDTVLADAASQAVGTEVHAETVRTGAITAVEVELNGHIIAGGNRHFSPGLTGLAARHLSNGEDLASGVEDSGAFEHEVGHVDRRRQGAGGRARHNQAAVDIVVAVRVGRPDPLRGGRDGAEATVVSITHLAVDIAPRADTIGAERGGLSPRRVVERAVGGGPASWRCVTVPAVVDRGPAAVEASLVGVATEAFPVTTGVGRVLDTVYDGGTDPATSAAGVKCIDGNRDSPVLDAEFVEVDGLPVASGVKVAGRVDGSVAAVDVGAATVHVGLVGTVDVNGVRIVGSDRYGTRARTDIARIRVAKAADVRLAAVAVGIIP